MLTVVPCLFFKCDGIKYCFLFGRHLGCTPIVTNASHFLPVERKRLFWMNLPRKDGVLKWEGCRLELGDILGPYRKAKVRKVPTLTTTSHSQRYGNLNLWPNCISPSSINAFSMLPYTGKSQQLPVQEDGKDVQLFITDMEALFGFPKSYTDGPNLTISDRRRLLGKAFCVPVLENLLQPLTDMYWLDPRPY